jgi:hypothetical protein
VRVQAGGIAPPLRQALDQSWQGTRNTITIICCEQHQTPLVDLPQDSTLQDSTLQVRTGHSMAGAAPTSSSNQGRTYFSFSFHSIPAISWQLIMDPVAIPLRFINSDGPVLHSGWSLQRSECYYGPLAGSHTHTIDLIIPFTTPVFIPYHVVDSHSRVCEYAAADWNLLKHVKKTNRISTMIQAVS